MTDYACKNCYKIINSKSCSACQGAQASKNWKGVAIILNNDKSVIAKKLKIESNGVFALRVR
ncbi:MAG: DNA-directed RNA polymerase subunit E'' [Candidatus Nanoarchaeia archaeon]|nr:DNA-directed RNA polymerase subunit E'' [Candidatus Nanoarchaeia archaeon]MDD5054456.1 DNA-directed RNA polymerase subunit E'' [Candidatus Nanoarchaeia archaeon]MDD5499423.1 DNA-directed RNA polymerase subunit E'' [Candidatus Nanoarchaeia archaeon]